MCVCVCVRSEEHTSELQSRPHISYAVFCLKKKKKKKSSKIYSYNTDDNEVPPSNVTARMSELNNLRTG